MSLFTSETHDGGSSFPSHIHNGLAQKGQNTADKTHLNSFKIKISEDSLEYELKSLQIE